MYSIRDEQYWHGSYYELAMEVSLNSDDSVMAKAFEAMSGHDQVEGFWSSYEGLGRAEVHGTAPEEKYMWHGYALLELPSLGTMGAVSHRIKDGDGLSDWLTLGLTTAALQQNTPLNYPLLRDNNQVLKEVDELFVSIAQQVHNEVGIELGIIGEESSGSAYSTTLEIKQLSKFVSYLLGNGVAKRLGQETCDDNHLVWVPPAAT